MFPAPLDNISSGIQTRHLANPLADALSFGIDDIAEVANTEMTRRQFDVAPVIVDGQPVGLFRSSTNLSGTVFSQMVPLSTNMLVSADTSLPDLVTLMLDTDFLYTLEGGQLTGFVTSADLGKAAARTHYYLLLAQTEIAISELLKSVYFDRQEEAILLLSPTRQAEHKSLVEKQMKGDSFIDNLSSLSLLDLVNIAGHNAEFQTIAGSEYGKSWGRLRKGLPQFRDAVMHSSRDEPAIFQPRKIQDMERSLLSLQKAVQGLLDR